jgi:hypothetical protein
MQHDTYVSERQESTSSALEWKSSPVPTAPPADVQINGPVARSPVMMPLSQLKAGESPRLAGQNHEHTRMLATVGAVLPPILVHRPTMRVIDGMHRLQAAILRGDDTIAVEFFDGSEREVFVRAVQANVEHGLPLTRADREAAVGRIIASHPELSDRAIAAVTGLSAPTVGVIRKRTSSQSCDVTARVGLDGRIRPLNSAEGRRKAGDVIRERPDASLREVAREAGVSVGTVRDVRNRIRRGEDVTIGLAKRPRPSVPTQDRRVRTLTVASATAAAPEYRAALENLRRDPSLRFNETGRTLLQWLGVHAIPPESHATLVEAIPPHCTKIVAELARASAAFWDQVANQLERRVRDLA